jgi:hypothetical protein
VISHQRHPFASKDVDIEAASNSPMTSDRRDVVPTDPEALLGRKEIAAALTAKGFPTSPATLSTQASRGGGPPYSKYGSRALYRWGTSLSWAQARLTPPITTTSEAPAPEVRSARGISVQFAENKERRL